mgnify:CR=1 FL=1
MVLKMPEPTLPQAGELYTLTSSRRFGLNRQLTPAGSLVLVLDVRDTPTYYSRDGIYFLTMVIDGETYTCFINREDLCPLTGSV